MQDSFIRPFVLDNIPHEAMCREPRIVVIPAAGMDTRSSLGLSGSFSLGHNASKWLTVLVRASASLLVPPFFLWLEPFRS